MANVKTNLNMFLLTITFALSPSVLEGQSGRLEIDGDPVDIVSDYSEEARDAIYLPDGGRIAVVGVSRVSKNNTDGFLLVYDPETRTAQRTRYPYSESTQDAFNCVARADNSHLYVGGHALNSAGKQQSLLIQYNEDLGRATKPYLSGSDSSSFEKIVWLNGDRGLLAGMNSGGGTIWLSTVEGNAPPGSEREPVGNGAVKDLSAMVYSPEHETVWLCGNTRNFLDMEAGNTWIARLNSRLDEKEWRPIETDIYEVVTAAAPGQEGELYMAGYSKSKNNGSKQGWMLEISPDMEHNPPFLFGTNQPDTATAITQVSDATCMMAYCTEPIGGIGRPKTRASVCRRIDEECLNSEIARAGDLKVVKIFEIAEDEFLLVGSANVPNREGQRCVRFIHLKQTEPVRPAKRGGNTRGNLAPAGKAEIAGCRIKDPGCVVAGETATLYISIKNAGDEALRFAHVFLKSSDGRMLKMLDIPLIKPGATQEVSTGLPVTSQLISGGALPLQISLENKENTLLDERPYSFPVCALQADNPPPSHTPDSREPVLIMDDYESSTNRGEVSLGATIRSNKPVPQGEITIKTGQGKKGKNKRTGQISDYSFKNVGEAIYDTRFKIKIALDTGFNDIQFGLGDHFVFHNSITIEYKPFRPDLHVFAIGPRYEKPFALEYVENDIREIVQKMKEQAGAGWYDQVYVETLTYPEIANQLNIEFFLDSIPEFRTIKEKDYVLLYLAGHGSLWTPKSVLTNQDSVTNDLCFWPSGYIAGKDESTGFHYNKWAERVLDKIRGKKLVFIDACNSGAGRGNPNPAVGEAMKRANEILKGAATFYSSKPGQLSHESPTWQHGAFTKALLEALEGKEITLTDGKKADPDGGYPNFERPEKQEGIHDGLITVYELQSFLSLRVPDLVRAEFGKTVAQQPEFRLKKEMTDDTVIFAIPKR